MTLPAGSLRMLHMQRPVNDRQRAVLDWLAADPDDAPPVPGYKNVAIALQTRGLAQVSRPRGVWTATLTDAGRYYHENGCYPPAGPNRPHPVGATPPASESPGTLKPKRRTISARKRRLEPEPEFEVDSPKRVRAQGFKLRGDALRVPDEPDPWDARVMITVKEAAWLLSLSEHEIRRAVTNGEIDRVFIGAGTSNYRVVYGSLLAWVNQMPRHSLGYQWWSRW